MKVGIVVEGHGDVRAVPIVVRRVANALGHFDVDVLQPHRVARSKMVKPGELERVIEFVARKLGTGGPILIVADADDDCPAALGPALLERARAQRSDREIAVVLANREFEAWFIAAAKSLAGQRELPRDLVAPEKPEEIIDAKGWLGGRMPRGYSETLDQPALAATMDLAQAAAAPSFDKLMRDVARLLGPPKRVA